MAKIKESLLKEEEEKPDDGEDQMADIVINAELRENAELKLAEAYHFWKDGNLERAIEKCTKAIETDPSFASAYGLRAYIYLLLPQYEKYLDNVIQDCTKVIEIEPNDASAYNEMGRAYIRKGEPEKAILNYGKALERDPSLAIAALNKMSAEICLGRYKDAISTHGAWRQDVVSQNDILISASLICIALALDGKSHEEYIEPLHDDKFKIRYLDDWNPSAIDKHLDKLKKEGYFPNRCAKAEKIQKLFKEHFK